MKNIETIIRGTNGVALQFTAKNSNSELEYLNGEFNVKAPLNINGNSALDSTYLTEIVTDNATIASVTYTQSEVQQVMDDLIALKDAMRLSGILKS